MRKSVQLRDGSEVIIRKMRKDDVDKSFAFFQKLTPEDRMYLRKDVTKREIVEERIRAMKSGKVRRLAVLYGGEIVADGSLELETEDWKEHIGELRLIVAPAFQRKGVGTLLAKELYLLAARKRVEEIVVKMMRPQTAAISIFKRLGFSEAPKLSQHVRDLSGSEQDLIVMRCKLQTLLQEIEDFLAMTDWQRTR